MKRDRHIVESREVLRDGMDVQALCGKTFKRSKITPLSDTGWIPGSRSDEHPAGICYRCLEVKVFRYLVGEAEEILQAEGK